MRGMQSTYTTIDEYIAMFPEETQTVLNELRAVIHAAAPDAEEAIRYGMPTFRLEGNLVHFAAFKSHYGFYPTSSGTEKFKAELAGYSSSKGTIRFPLGEPIPYDLIRKIVAFRVQENLERAAAKGKKKR